MTKDEHDADIAEAVREYSRNKGEIACLERRLMLFYGLLRQVVDAATTQPAKLPDVAAFQSDPREDAKALKDLLDAQGRLRELFKAHNLMID